MAGTTTNQKLIDWVEHWREIFEPADVHWCDGTAEEYDRLRSEERREKIGRAHV